MASMIETWGAVLRQHVHAEILLTLNYYPTSSITEDTFDQAMREILLTSLDRLRPDMPEIFERFCGTYTRISPDKLVKMHQLTALVFSDRFVEKLVEYFHLEGDTFWHAQKTHEDID